MKIVILGVLTFFVGIGLGYFGMHFFVKNIFLKGKVLSQQTPILTSTLSPTPVPSPTNILTPTPTLAPTPTPLFVQKFTPQEIHGFIERFSAQYNVDPNILRHIAICESGFNPSAVNFSYAGLYQFASVTWKKYRLEMGEETNPNLRFNAEEAVQTAAFVLSTNRAYIWPSCVP